MAEEKKKTARKKAAPEKAAAQKKVLKKKEKVEAVVQPTEEIKQKPPEEAPKIAHPPKAPRAPRVAIQKFCGTGRRKSAMARVFISLGKGSMSLNSKTAEEYFCGRPVLLATIKKPLALTDNLGRYDVVVSLQGGGVAAQADAVRMGISRALLEADPGLRKVLRSTDMLRRDPREKERKKYGLKRARRAFQYTKR